MDVEPERRAQFATLRCADDPELLAEVLALIETERQGLGEFLAVPVLRLTPSESAPTPLPEIGPYHIESVIGEGGMGIVYRARQEEPVRREVALKLIKPGMDSAAVLARFAAERQTLAMLKHRGIATVFDAGADALGRPWFSMEFIDGPSLTRFCDRERLAIPERLRLFIDVCHAVQHAHDKGVIHRDLKPSNMLVVVESGTAVPKVIDFGIARSLEQPIGGRSVYTEAGAFIGTPEYMSPEQADSRCGDVDTRSDVYSLGVILYELLVGALPFDAAALRRSSHAELLRILVDVEPPRPSLRVAQLADPTPAATARRLEPRAHRRRLAGELDWITLRALAKEPSRRYPSALALAEDLTRHLHHEPVEAGPPSAVYRVRKFARRYRLQVTAALLLVAALTVGIATTSYYLVLAQENEAIARTAQRHSEGLRLAVQAKSEAAAEPTRALLLALQAAARVDDPAVTEAIAAAMPHHRELRTLYGHSSTVEGVAWHPRGHLLLSHATEPVALVWDTSNWTILHRLPHPTTVRAAHWVGDGDRILTACNDGAARLWTIADGTCAQTVPCFGDRMTWVRASADGSVVAAAARTGEVCVFDVRTQRMLLTLGPGNVRQRVDLRADGTDRVGATLEHRGWSTGQEPARHRRWVQDHPRQVRPGLRSDGHRGEARRPQRRVRTRRRRHRSRDFRRDPSDRLPQRHLARIARGSRRRAVRLAASRPADSAHRLPDTRSRQILGRRVRRR